MVEGSYFGPEYISFKDTAGRNQTALIRGHELIEPVGWPVLPEHNTELMLTIVMPTQDALVDKSCVIQGLGSVLKSKGAVDLSNELSNPSFWAGFAEIYWHSEEFEEPGSSIFGLSADDLNGYYESVLSPLLNTESWPIFPLPLDEGRYLEFEMAGGAEFQDRLWIGKKQSESKVLLGY